MERTFILSTFKTTWLGGARGKLQKARWFDGKNPECHGLEMQRRRKITAEGYSVRRQWRRLTRCEETLLLFGSQVSFVREKTKNITCRFNSDVGSSSRLCDPPSRSHTQPSGRRSAGTGNCEACGFGNDLTGQLRKESAVCT